MITASELRNIIAIMRSVDRHEIEAEAGQLPEAAWARFRDDPYMGFLKFYGLQQEAVARIVSARIERSHGLTPVAAAE